MDADFYEILKKNIRHVSMQASSAAEKNFAHLHELADLISSSIIKETGYSDILHAVIHTDEAARIYRERFIGGDNTAFFAPVNSKEEPFFCKQSDRFARLYLCRSIAKKGKHHSFADLNPLFFGLGSETEVGPDRKIAFLRNRQAFRAFECFAKVLGGVSVLYENNFQNACEAVALGQATYAIIPIYSTSDGRLNSFYRMIEKYELNIVQTCDVDSDDGENSTTFALLYRERLYLGSGAPRFECKITFDDLAAIADITDAASYYGASVESIESLPMMFSGRTGTFAVVFGLQNADIDGLLCYLALEYPQMSVVGIYGKSDHF